MTYSKFLWHLVIRVAIISILFLVITNAASAESNRMPVTKANDSNLASTPEKLPTPELIQQDFINGKISEEQELLYLAYAISDYEKLPIQYQSNVPWDGTIIMLRLENEPLNITSPVVIQAIRLATSGQCGASSVSLPNVRDTTHFHIEYDAIAAGLTIDDYATSLEGAWDTEITNFGWATPPVLASNPPPGNRYHIRIDALSGGLLGDTNITGVHTGLVGNNPNTSWNDVDAYASCIRLRNDYSGFPGGSRKQFLETTSAHEFHHSIQFGLGAITGSNAPDLAFIESSAAWMEDEVYDSANISNNDNRLWPAFTTSMGEYTDYKYSYWLVFRGLTERYGKGTAGGAEQVMQDFWEETSKSSTSNMLPALNTGLKNKGTNLADAYHAFAIAAKFVKPCSGSYVYPYCFAEAADYLAIKSLPDVNGTISSIGGSYSGNIQDNYALNWVKLPTSKPYSISFQNTSTTGQFRVSIVADTGKTLQVTAFPKVVGGNDNGILDEYNPPEGAKSIIAVITNQDRTGDNPSSITADSYKLVTARPISFVIDDTGSMSDDIDQVKVVVNQKVDEFASKGIYPMYHLLTFKDDVNYRGATSDPTTIKSWINGLTASAGGDCPEEMLGALNRIAQEALHSEAWVMSDAGFHGGAGDLANTIYNLVKAGVKVHPIIYYWCFDASTSGSSADGQDGDSCTPQASKLRGLGADSFAQLAIETGGHFFQISASETQGAAIILLNEMITPADLTTNTDHVASGSPKTYNIQIDGTVQEANFLLNGLTGSTDLVIYRPGGTQVNSSDTDVTFTGISNARYYQITLPTPGVWQAQVVGDGDFAFSASGNTPISFDFLSDTSLPVGKAANVQVSLTGPVTSATFNFTHLDGTSSGIVTLYDDGLHRDGTASDGIYGGVWTPASTGDYYFRVQGITESGAVFEQVVSKIIRVQGLNVEASPDLLLYPGSSIKHDFAITNNGSSADTYDLTYASTQGWADFSSLPESISIAAGATTHIQIPLNVPASTTPSTIDRTTLVAVSQTNPMINDAASVEITIINGYQLSITKSGTGNGTVTSDPAGLDCGTTCSAFFDANGSVTLNATPDSNSNFSNWGGACSGSGACIVTMDSAKSVDATFTLKAPSTPSNFRVVDTTQAIITIGWDNVSDENGYKIYKWLYINNAWDFYYFTTVGANVTSFTEKPGLGNHYYQVSAFNSFGESARAVWVGGGCSGTSTCSVFTGPSHSTTANPNSLAKPPSIPSLVSPKNKALTTNYRPRLDWSNSTISGGTKFQKYELQLAKDRAFTDAVTFIVSRSPKKSVYKLEIDLDPNTTYYWRVRAYNTLDLYSGWSAVRSFHTALHLNR
jgi:hypothetical protein